jgi:glutamyl-tRNA synthetase
MASEVSPARTRFAPSPTGSLHIGGARTAFYDWLLARQTGGQFILRIEDTDRNRFVEGGVEEIMDGLRWLGLDWDEGPDKGGPYGPYLQSERLPIYHQYIQRLLDSGHAYRAYHSKEEIDAIRAAVGESDAVEFNRRLRSMPADEIARREADGVQPIVLFRMPDDGDTQVHDEIRGDIRFPNRSLRDPVLLKSDGFPTYHFAAMVDDGAMKITHVLRSEEWLPSLPLHALIIKALGWEMPHFYHPSVFLDPSGKGKMSKRRGSTTDQPTFVRDFREAGFLPEAILNWAALMGWAESGGDREVYTVPELIEAFSLDRLRPSPAAVNYDKAEWLNGVHIRALPADELARRLVPFMHRAGISVSADDLIPLVPLVQERLTLLDEAPDLLDFFFVPPPPPDPAELVPKKLTPAEARGALEATRAYLATVESFDAGTLEAGLRALAEERGIKAGDLFTILRVALSSKRVAPPLFGTIAHLGWATTAARLDRALEILANT